MAMTLEVEALAQEIRRVDGNHSLGAGTLAEALMLFIAPHITQPAQAVDVGPDVSKALDLFDACCLGSNDRCVSWRNYTRPDRELVMAKFLAALPTSPTDKDQR